MIVQFTRNTDDPRKVNKVFSAVTPQELSGTFKTPFNLRTPTLLLDNSNLSDPTILFAPLLPNYARVSKEYQGSNTYWYYYFIRDIRFVTNNLIEVDLELDVLKTFATEIMSTRAFVERYEENLYPMLEDHLRPLEYKKVVETSSFILDSRCTYFNIHRDITLDNARLIALTVYLDKTGSETLANDLNARFPGHFPTTAVDPALLFRTETIPGFNYGGAPIYAPDIETENINTQRFIVTYLLTRYEFGMVQQAVSTNDALASFIIGAVELPFSTLTDFAKTRRLPGTDTEYSQLLIIGNTIIKTVGGSSLFVPTNAYGSTSKYIINAIDDDLPMITPQSFLDVEPYTQYEIYIPFYGWAQIPSSLASSNNGYVLYYSIDLVTGSGMAYLKLGGLRSDFTFSCQIGNQLSVNTTNFRENENARIANATKTTFGLLGSIASIGIGVATFNPVAVAGGLISAGTTIGQAVNTNLALLDRGNVSYDGKLSAYYDDLNSCLKRSYTPPIFASNTTEFESYAHEYGLPYNRSVLLSSLTSGKFVKVGAVHLDNFNAPKPIKDEIETLLKTGVIL